MPRTPQAYKRCIVGQCKQFSEATEIEDKALELLNS